ncbi:S46 family peptidase [Porphyromonas pogonae]|uniref:S46 family peptidase n=1 Tax=Porphyromonas pogonae TaxID=867595 RepID=UPI002E7720A1|nr:S46 family peptidase [Porphyromonas pogonae]
MKHHFKTLVLGACLFLGLGSIAKADKGMWILNELNKQNIEKMKELGFKLSADSLYSLNKPSIANAVVIFGGGCTGITVSNTGLIFTNHHCGYSSIQSKSSVDHDYLRDGFVSQSINDEIPIEGLKVKYLRSVKDVTKEVLDAIKDSKDEMERLQKAGKVCSEMAAKENEKLGKHAQVIVEPFYANNAYYMIAYDVFEDVRMVFAPPSSIGKFGGDTDNWMWPRHTGDFSVFRVYADKDNNPASYNKDNKPYKPKYFAAVSMQGYKPGDYAMTIGFPGSTERYIPSWGVKSRMENENAPRIEVRGVKQEIWKKAMQADQATRIKYASKYAQSANYWKNSIGMNRGIQKLDVIGRKEAEERAFADWVKKGNKSMYSDVLSSMEQAYKASGQGARDMGYMYEALIGGAEIGRISQYVDAMATMPQRRADLLNYVNEHNYKDYLPALDKKVLPAMLDLVRKKVPADKLPDIYQTIDKQFGGSTQKYTDYLFSNSIVPYKEKVNEIMKNPSADLSNLSKTDPGIIFGKSVLAAARKLQTENEAYAMAIEKGNRLYFAGRREMDPKRLMPSDANFTMRMSYGSIKGYEPADAVTYRYYTTDKGLLEKYDPNSDEFNLQKDILDLVKRKDFGKYGVNGNLNIAFLSTNDITGGNSGSPVFDKNGRLIGLAFDGNWEAMSGDIEFEPDLQRTISVDIRYVLWTIDKWGKCPRLIKELKMM